MPQGKKFKMASDAVMLVIGRLETDPLFCSALVADSAGAIVGLGLTQQETDEVVEFIDMLGLTTVDCGSLSLSELDMRLKLLDPTAQIYEPKFITW